ncbi:MAG TPA: peptide chain release factor N(5)-glutamine methyltransferase [Gammaproteobacteria bacterium]
MRAGPLSSELDRARCYRDAVRAATAALERASDTPRLDAELLVAHAVPAARSAVIAFPERLLAADAARRLAALVARRAAGEPLAYLVGRKEFRSLDLVVGPAVLVPRPETEHLVEAALARLDGVASPAVLDLGTGSGAIALAIKAERPDAQVVAVDASAAALDVARANGACLGLDVDWRRSDWFSAVRDLTFDAIVCNPPYVASGDPHLAELVHEPRAALDGGPDGLDAIRAVLHDAPARLRHGGVLLVEHGSDQQTDVAGLAAAAGFDVVERGRDLAGRDRYVVLARPRARP